MTSDPEKRRLAELEAQITAAKARNAPPARTQEGKAWSIGAEFVGGVLVGSGMGWWLDKWLGTKPWFFIGMMILGFIVGTVNAMRFAKRIESGDETETK